MPESSPNNSKIKTYHYPKSGGSKRARTCPGAGTYCPSIPDGGWHFEYFGKRETLLEKLAAFSHAGEPGCENFRMKVEAGALPGLERTTGYPVEKLPRFVRENRERWAGSFSP